MKKGNNYLKFAIFFSIILLFVLIVFVSPIFNIREIEIRNNYVVSNNEILSISGLANGMNLLSFSASSKARDIETLPFIHSATISRGFPDRLYITVLERIPIAAVRIELGDIFLIVDEYAMVVDIVSNAPFGLPLVTGLNITNFGIGLYLDNHDRVAFQTISTLSRIFNRYDFKPDAIDLSDVNDIRIHYNNVILLFGSINDADRKVQAIHPIYNALNLDGDTRGFIHMQDLSVNPRFELLR